MKKYICLIIILLSGLSRSQVLEYNTYEEIYRYLSRLDQKNIVIFNDQVKPLDRKYIYGKLREAETIAGKLTPLEREELNFYLKEFASEAVLAADSISSKRITFLKKDIGGRYRLFSYLDDFFKISVNPIFGYERAERDGKSSTHQWNGLSFSGYLGKNIGFSFDFRDNSESGDYDGEKKFTPATGIVRSQTIGKTMEYSETRAALSAYWSWGEIMLGKDFLIWGYGEGGNIVNSSKSPSYPMIRLDIHPVEWLRFNYVHAWLSSDVIDSSSIRITEIGRKSYSYRDKYLVSHTFIITPVKGLDISLGESIIYGDKFQEIYLIPLIFFRAADHYIMNEKNEAGGNCQFFLSASSRGHIKNTRLYGSLFIDDITISGLFDPEKQKNQIGFSLGGSVSDIPVNNLTITAEYMKIYPFVYRHYVPTLTYESSGYGLGHWMGSNADQIYGSLNYRILRGLNAQLFAQYVRKGEEAVLTEKYTIPPQPPFLHGLRTNYTQVGLEAKYEFIHNLFAKAEFVYNKISREQEAGDFLDDNYNEFSFAVYYGL